MKQKGITAYRAAKDTGITASQFSKWRKNPTSRITSENLAKMAEYLGCSVDVLVGKSILKVKRLCPGAKLPRRATAGSAGCDLCACIRQKLTVLPGQTVSVPTGLALALPKGYGGFIFARSGLGLRHGIVPGNCVGVIDADYRGEIGIILINLGEEDFTVNDGDRICQMVIKQYSHVKWDEVKELDRTKREDGAFGHTGIS